jgi:CRISPR-associated protein Csa3
MLVVVTLGFNEALALRGLMKRGIKEEDNIVVIKPISDDERSRQALEAFKLTLEKIGVNKIEVLEIDPSNLLEAVSKISNFLKQRAQREVYANLSGGMRILILEVLLGMAHTFHNATVEIYSEDGKTSIILPLDILCKTTLEPYEVEVLKALSESKTISEASKKLNSPKSRVWRVAKKLEEKGLVSEGKLTEKGKLYLSLYSSR